MAKYLDQGPVHLQASTWNKSKITKTDCCYYYYYYYYYSYS